MTIKDNNFMLRNKIIDFKDYQERYILNNIPKVHTDVRIHLSDEIYNLIKYMYYASYTKGNIRLKYLVDLSVSISMLDTIISDLKKYKTIKEKYIINSIDKLNDIRNIVYGWKFNEEKIHK